MLPEYHLLIGDSNTKLYFSGLNKGKNSVEELKNAQNVAKQSTIGLTLAQTALNAAISLGFTAALMLNRQTTLRNEPLKPLTKHFLKQLKKCRKMKMRQNH